MNFPDIESVRLAYERCSWGNTLESAADWQAILEGDDDAAKRRLFSRIFLEAPDGITIKALFTENQIRTYLAGFERPLSRSHIERRRKVWRFLYLGERSPIPELDWII